MHNAKNANSLTSVLLLQLCSEYLVDESLEKYCKLNITKLEAFFREENLGGDCFQNSYTNSAFHESNTNGHVTYPQCSDHVGCHMTDRWPEEDEEKRPSPSTERLVETAIGRRETRTKRRLSKRTSNRRQKKRLPIDDRKWSVSLALLLIAESLV